MGEITCVGVLAHPLRPQTFPIAKRIADSLTTHDLRVQLYTEWSEDDVKGTISDYNMVVAIGGDGAMLRAARVCAPHAVPVLGINMGQLGFLTEIQNPADWDSYVERVLQQDYWIEQRMMINTSLLRDGETIASDDALNDTVISGGVFGRMIELETFIDGHWTTTYFADALVVATATGSTAYALAIGGPILPPQLNNILILPAAPHLSMDRPIVLSEGATVEVKATSSRGEIVITTDGVFMANSEPGDIIKVQVSEHSTRFIRLRGSNYFYRSLLDRLEPRVRQRGLERHEK